MPLLIFGRSSPFTIKNRSSGRSTPRICAISFSIVSLSDARAVVRRRGRSASRSSARKDRKLLIDSKNCRSSSGVNVFVAKIKRYKSEPFRMAANRKDHSEFVPRPVALLNPLMSVSSICSILTLSIHPFSKREFLIKLFSGPLLLFCPD